MTRRRKAKSPSTAARPSRPQGLKLRISEPAWLGIGAASILVLLWSCRGALFGVPTADDYDFLYWLRFHPFSLLDSMGAPYYWRPLSRQLYFALVAPILYTAPWLVTVLHALLLMATSWLIYRIARRLFSPGIAVAIAVFPLLAEPTRSLLIWPTAAQYVLAALGAALALHEALAGRRWTAGLAALGALLSHGAAAPVLAATPAIAWFRTRRVREALVWAGISLAVAAVWVGGHWLGREHGTRFFAGGTLDATLPARWAQGIAWTVTALFNLEDARPAVATFAWAGYAALLALACFFFAFDPRARARLRRVAPALAGATAWFLLCVLPLALLFPDWSSWRTPLAALGLAFLAAGLLGTARPWLAAGFVAVLAATLLAAPLASTVVSRDPPETRSRMGFVRLVRLQRAVDGARTALHDEYPRLRQGADIAYWSRFAMMEVGFEREKAARVWYRDSTITWEWLWRPGGLETRQDALLGFDPGMPRPVVLIVPRTMDRVREAISAIDQGQARAADSLLVEALRAQQGRPCTQVTAWAIRTRARIAYQVGAYVQAEKMNEATLGVIGPTSEYYGMAALIALRRGDRENALQNAQRSLALDSQNPFGVQAMAELRP